MLTKLTDETMPKPSSTQPRIIIVFKAAPNQEHQAGPNLATAARTRRHGTKIRLSPDEVLGCDPGRLDGGPDEAAPRDEDPPARKEKRGGAA
jgi:hypothetical protein